MAGIGQFTERQVESIMDDISTAMKRLALDIPAIPEAIFLQHLYPILQSSAEGKGIDLGIWTDIAGTTYRPIDVVDTTGTVLFQIPPIQRQLTTEMRTRDLKSLRNSTDEILKNTSNLAKNSPRKALAYMHEKLSAKVVHDPIDMAHALVFDGILKRYGHPGLGLGALTDTNNTPVVEKPTIEGYDEFDF